jgi:hypothetical protein
VAFATQALAQPDGRVRAAVSSIVAQHAIAQQGLSIGLDAGFVQGQIAVATTTPRVGRCVRISAGGSVKTLQGTRTGNTSRLTVEVSYDNRCQDRYLNARLTARKRSSSRLTARERATLYGVTGHVIGRLVLSESVTVEAAKLNLSATGSFTPAGSTAVDLGFNCDIPDLVVLGDPSGNARCHVGIAQTLQAVGGDLASVTPMLVHLRQSSEKATFSANNAELARGASGALGISAPTIHSLAITGPDQPVGTASGNGSFAVFSVFQKGPSSWQSTDTGNGVRFAMSLPTGGKTLKGTIKQLSNNATLATLAVDLSGTGTIKYSNNQTAPIKSWVLTN